MRLIEHDGKALLANAGIPIPRGMLVESATPPDDAPWVAAMVKAQLLSGGRGKRGLVARAEAGGLAGTIRAATRLMQQKDFR